MPEEQLKDIQQSEPVVDVPTEGDPVDIELKEDKAPKEQEAILILPPSKPCIAILNPSPSFPIKFLMETLQSSNIT